MKTIMTKRLLLRPVVPEDAPYIYEYSRERNVGPNAGWKPHESLAETKEISEQIFIGQNVWAVIERQKDLFMGTIGLPPDPKREYQGARMLGYAIGEAYWGKGYMTEAAKAVLLHEFQSGDAEIISGYCYPFNVRSQRVLIKCGMHYEGILRMAEEIYDGSIYDHLCYSVTKKEFSNTFQGG